MNGRTVKRKSQGRNARKARLVLAETENPKRLINEIFPAAENLRHPRCAELRKRFELEKVVAGERDEFRRILLLRHWIRKQIRISNKRPTPVRMEAIAILDRARTGGRFHCAHFSLVQHAVLNAFGYVTRRIGAGNGDISCGRHHGINEVWVNSLCKWVLVDAKYDLHFEKDGLPLSALEIRDEVLADGGKRLCKVFGPERRSRGTAGDGRADTYRWISWEPNTAHFTDFPSDGLSTLILYDDAYARKHIWYRDGNPHWAYRAGFFLRILQRDWIEWTPNVIESEVTMTGKAACIALESSTPNFATYLMRSNDRGPWRPCADRLEIELPLEGLCLVFRARNFAGVDGPEHRICWLPETA